MLYGPDRLPELVGRDPKIGLTVKLPAGGCGSCPSRMCASCPLRPVAVVSSGALVFNKPGNLNTLGKSTTPENVAIEGVKSNLPVGLVGGTARPVSSENACDQCGENSKTCPHSKRYQKAA